MQKPMPRPHEDDLPARLRINFGLQDETAFAPHSLWFSYGSNLDGKYLARKMAARSSELTLADPKNAILGGFERLLDNESKRHGLGYEIHCKDEHTVEGIVHRVPSKDLRAFLWMEGVCDENGAILGSPTYWVVNVSVQLEGKSIPVLSLVGNKRCTGYRREQLARDSCTTITEYVEASLNGAKVRGIDSTQFSRDLAWVKSLR